MKYEEKQKEKKRKPRVLLYRDTVTISYKKNIILETDGSRYIALHIVLELLRGIDGALYHRFIANKQSGTYNIQNLFGVDWMSIDEPLLHEHTSVLLKFQEGKQTRVIGSKGTSGFFEYAL